MRSIYRELTDGVRSKVTDPLLLAGTATKVDDSGNEWGKRLLAMLWPNSLGISGPNVTASPQSSTKEILRAMQMARASTQRREIPVDDGSWDRMARAHHVSVAFLQERMNQWQQTESSRVNNNAFIQMGTGFLEPLLGLKVPKKGSSWRLKALPCPEDLTLQQYLLNELLMDHVEVAPSFSGLIPAVRHEFGRSLYMTGPNSLLPKSESGRNRVLSFAYQIEMDVLNGEGKTIRDGLFRPYIDCWKSFTDFVEESVRIKIRDRRKLQTEGIFVSRLDIKGFYDNVSRSTVQNALLQPLTSAFESNPSALAHVAAAIAPPSVVTPQSRAMQLISFLCDLTFNYPYSCPQTGKPKRIDSPGRGLPQGPDLSAYLANVALFRFDATIDQIVQKTSDAVCYARYVDDMIIVANSRHALEQVSQAVSFELNKLSLELSPKSKTLEPMSFNGVRAWLRDERGTQDVSTIFETVVPSDSILADDHGVDRRDALIRLRDISDFSSENLPTIRRNIQEVFKCGNLRYNDLCRATATIWFAVAAEYLNDETIDLVQRFETLLNESKGCLLYTSPSPRDS